MRDANQSFAAALRGPVIMITVGVLFLLDKFSVFQFGATWPVLLIVLGALALAGGWRRYPAQAPGIPQVMHPMQPGMPVDPPQAPPPGVRR